MEPVNIANVHVAMDEIIAQNAFTINYLGQVTCPMNLVTFYLIASGIIGFLFI